MRVALRTGARADSAATAESTPTTAIYVVGSEGETP